MAELSMSPLGTALVAVMSVEVVTATLYMMHYVRRPSDRTYLFLALTLVGMSVRTLGTVVLTEASSLALGATGTGLQHVGVYIAVIFSVPLVSDASGSDQPVLKWSAVSLAGMGLLVVALDLYLDTGHPLPTPAWGLDFAPDYRLPRLLPLGTLCTVLLPTLALSAIARLWPPLRHQPDLRTLRWPAAALLLAGLHDMLILLGLLRSVFLLDFGALVLALGSGGLLLGRFDRARRALAARTQDLERSHADLQHAQQELVQQRKLAAIGELAAVIAHEVRNPLAVLKNAASGLRRAEAESPQEDQLTVILQEETERLGRVVHDLLAFTRPLDLRQERVDAARLVQAVVDQIRKHDSPDPAPPLRLDLGACPRSTIEGDRELLRLAIANVVQNAVQATPAERTVRIIVEREAEALAITVSDAGSGMSDDVIRKARNPFFTTRPTGTGLGLAIVDRVVQAHGGELRLESPGQGRGSRVTIALPAGPS